MGRNIVVFTLHKSASMFLHKQCEHLCRVAGIAYHSPNLPGSGLDARRLLTDTQVWQRRGCIAPVRFFVDIPAMPDFEILLHLRDPRDVLVSMFYSYCFIHPGPLEANTGYRQEAAARGIDAFVLDKCSERSRDYPGDYGTGGHVEDLIGNLPQRYRRYLDHLVGKPNVRLLKYEQMVTDYGAWLDQFIQVFPITDKTSVTADLVAQSAVLFPRRERDVMNHVRHVAPGDHKHKLQPATIRELDAIFADTLDALGYARSASAGRERAPTAD